MKITYIHHSAFLAETASAALLFDYFRGDVPEIPAGRTLYVFASHRHADHFSNIIFDLAEKYSDIHYILSYDIWQKRVPDELKERTTFLKPGERYEDALIQVEAFRSTDEGIAFWCGVDGLEIYHAGDLNHWYWKEEEEQWTRDMTAAYRNEIHKMKGRIADAAFLPLDPRLHDAFFLGIDDFMKEADAKAIFPMHFWEQYDVTERLKKLPCATAYKDKLIEIEYEGQEFYI